MRCPQYRFQVLHGLCRSCFPNSQVFRILQIYPALLSKPVIKDYLWGGTRLKTEFGFETDKKIAAEGWMLSCHKDGTNTVEDGAYAGKPLDEVLKHWGYEEKSPILIKLIDAKDRLSV